MSNLTKDQLFDILEWQGIQSIEIQYDGYGDSGDIEDVIISPVGITHKYLDNLCLGDKERMNESVLDLVKSEVYTYLGDIWVGWEINDGSFGEFVFTVHDRKIVNTHNQRHTTYDTFERDL